MVATERPRCALITQSAAERSRRNDDYGASRRATRGQVEMVIKTARSAHFLAGALMFGCAASSAMAAPSSAGRDVTQVAEAAQAKPPVAVDEDEPANCSKSRKRLWVEGEGWVVRRVTICR